MQFNIERPNSRRGINDGGWVRALGVAGIVTCLMFDVGIPVANARVGTFTTAARKGPVKSKKPAKVKAPVKKAAIPISKAGAVTTTTTVVPRVTSEAIAAGLEAPVFDDCVKGLDCTTLFLPLDYDHPDGDKIAVFVSLRRATNAAEKLGTLFVNPGGPGGPSLDLIRRINTVLPQEVVERYDIVGVDPRGTQRSAPLSCGDPQVSSSPGADASVTEAEAATLAKRCGENEPIRLSFIDTDANARDVDVVRAVLGAPKIAFLGFSYGTYLGTVYASLFPDRVQSMILDSAIDPSRFGTPFALDSFTALETAIDGFLDDCAKQGSTCPFNDGSDLRARYLQTRSKFIDAFNDKTAAASAFDDRVVFMIEAPPKGWASLAKSLVAVATADRQSTRLFDLSFAQSSGASSFRPFDGFSDAVYLATVCRDGVYSRDPAQLADLKIRFAAAAPRFSGLVTDRSLLNSVCPAWPVPSLIPPSVVPMASPVLVLANTFDTRTPLVWSQGLANLLKAPILIRDGGGHIAIGRSQCIDAAVGVFLLAGALPAAGSRC
jgi:pimeloyl-ACP methyl ester carboxylesterase